MSMSEKDAASLWGGARTRLPPPPDNAHVAAAAAIVRRLRDAGEEAYFVGGFVRDWLIGVEPEDIDIATSAPPDRVQKLFNAAREVGVHFGVVLVTMENLTFEVATFRLDGAYMDCRHPVQVTYGGLEDDAARRDFTLNAMYYDPVAKSIKDFHAGLLDLRRRVLRTVGPPVRRFEEDALRLMRAVRFTVRYELEIDDRTAKAIRIKAKNLGKISRERIGEELLRILTGPRPGRAMHLMSDLGLWEYVIPEVEALRGVEQGQQAHPEGDVFVHTALVLDHLPDDPEPALALAALLHDIGKPSTAARDEERIHFYRHQTVGAAMAREICANLRVSKALTDQVVELVEGHMQFMHVREMREAKLKRFLGRPDFHLHLELHRADSLGSHGGLDAYEFCIEHRRELAEAHGEGLAPEPLAGGDDLIALGLKPGPAFKQILDRLHDEQLEGRVTSRPEALEFLRKETRAIGP